MSKMAREVAEALAGPKTELPARFIKNTNTDELIRVARRLERLQSRTRKLRKWLKEDESAIKRCKKEMKALTIQIASNSDSMEDK